MSEAMQLAYEERGSGPVTVFVHGFPLDRRMWIGQLAGLAKIRRCVAIDLRGNGLSTISEEEPVFSMDLFADDLAATMDELDADTADIVGLSMGGYVAFAFWRRYRERVRSLILCDTKAEADSDEGKAGREKTAHTAREQGMEHVWEGLGPKLLAANPKPQDVERLREIFLAQPPAVIAADALAMRDRPDSTPDLSGIDVPVLWIHGEEDQLMPIDGGRATAAKIPGAIFAEIPNGGHMAPMENPGAANEALAAFLKGQPV
jgi:pimeloyl-ACP methyl ester carboxylesterase